MCKLLIAVVAICAIFQTVNCVTYNWKFDITVNEDQPKTSAVLIFTTLPADNSYILINDFVGGQNYTDIATFSVIGKKEKEPKGKELVEIKAVYIVDRNGTCPPPKAAKTLKLDRVSVKFIISQNKSYEKVVKDVALTLTCKNTTDKAFTLKDFKETSKKDCVFNDKYYDHKEEFTVQCSASCKCNDGGVGCKDMCGVYTADWSKCHTIKEYGRCCSHAQCVDDLESLKCDTTKVGPDFKPPWAVEIVVENEDSKAVSAKRICAGTIINRNWILTQTSCAGIAKSAKILHPISLSNSVNVTKVVLDNAENETRAHLAMIRVEPRIDFTETMHEVNLPWPSECPKYANSSCTYYMQSFTGVTNGAFTQMSANKTDSSHCSLQEKSKPVICLQMGPYPKCPNLAGTAVTVERSGGFYLTGYLYDSSAKYETGCDINQGKYRPMISICRRLSWIHNVTKNDNDN